MSPSRPTMRLPPATAVSWGAADGAADGAPTAVVGVLAGPDGAVTGVVELVLQAVATRAATASREAKRFISTPFLFSPLGNRQQPHHAARCVPRRGCECGAARANGADTRPNRTAVRR